MNESFWRWIAVALATILLGVFMYFVNANSEQWKCIGGLNNRVSYLEGMHGVHPVAHKNNNGEGRGGLTNGNR